MSIGTIHRTIGDRAALRLEKTAFADRSGAVHSFNDLIRDAHVFGAALAARGLAGRPAAITGEVDYGGVAAMLGCLRVGSPIVPLSHGLGADELRGLISEYEIGVLFHSPGCRDTAGLLAEQIEGLTVIESDPEPLRSAESAGELFPPVDPMAPAFLFSVEGVGGAMLSHKNICASLEALASLKDISSYTFLTPAVWGGAFDCVAGLLLPIYAGCTLVQRGEKRGAAKAISESGATALTCTPQRLRSLERALRHRSEKEKSGAAAAVSNFFGRIGSLLSPDIGKRMHRRVHRLLGENLKLIICGGSWPEQTGARQFTGWGIEVLSLWFTPECGPLAVYDSAIRRLTPMADLSVPSPIKGGAGVLYLSGDRIPLGYFGRESDFGDSFPTGDVGALTEDGTLELRGRRKTMLCGKDGEMIFPEELISVIRKSRYVADCTITGRYDTKTADVLLTAHLTPDFREVNRKLGEKYSPNRLWLFMDREMAKLEAELPHKIHEFTLPD